MISKEDKKFLDTLESVFEENQDSLEEAVNYPALKDGA